MPDVQHPLATYLDASGTAPLKPAVLEGLIAFLRDSGGLVANPSSVHAPGRRAKRVVSEARDAIARSLSPKLDPEQLMFCASGSEANQTAIRAVLERALARERSPVWITTPVEHDSVVQLEPWFEARGGRLARLKLDGAGAPTVQSLAAFFASGTKPALLSVIAVNNETGVLSPLEGFAALAQAHGVPLHVDAAQAWGKIPLNLETIKPATLALSAHKIGGLQGVGALALGRGAALDPLVWGKQEKGRRGGTENVLGILAAGLAAREVDPERYAREVTPLRDRLEREVRRRISGVRINGEGGARVAGTTNLSFAGLGGEGLVLALDLEGFALSAGSACSSGAIEPSRVLRAMGLSREEATAALRISLSEGAIPNEGALLDALEAVVARMRERVGGAGV